MSLDKAISPYIASQFPRLYKEEGPAFIAFVKCYYEWMEQTGGVIAESKSLPEYRDIDDTKDEFLRHFKIKYMNGLPEDVLGDKRTLQKHIKEIYSSKGTTQGLELLFRLLYNESSDIYLPGDDILRPSDGVWIQPVYLEVSVNPLNVLLIGEKITGRESGATAIVEDFQIRYINKRQINVLFLSNVRGDFKTDELILSSVISDPLKSPTIIGSMTEIQVNESGFGFKVGDVLDVNNGSGVLGKAVVSSISPRNGAVEFNIVHGGSGYANNNPWAPNIVTVTPLDPGNPGIGADFEIGELSNTEIITTAVDAIAPYGNTQLNSPDYQFPTNVGVENINTPLNQALNVQNIVVGTIRSLRAINPGSGYNGPVTVQVENPVIAGLMIADPVNGNYKGNNAIVEGKASSGNGAIDTVKIINSGIGYANGDVITLSNENIAFIAGGVAILQKQGTGEGYWKDTRSFLNSDKYIQDSYYYQEYSYETRLSVAFSYYSDLLKKLFHPAGTEAFGKVVITTEVDSGSEAVEVEIIATRLTEYMTQFSTFVQTAGLTSTTFVTQYATEKSTVRPTITNRLTQEDYLVDQPNLVINGSFAVGVANWVARGATDLVWSSAGRARVTQNAGDGTIVQMVPVTIGHTYQIDATFANGTANGATLYIGSQNSTSVGVYSSNTTLGSANTLQLTFTANTANAYVILGTSGSDDQQVEFDNVLFRDVPTLNQLTQFVTVFQRETAVNSGSRQTVYNTTTTFNTAYNTAYNTVFDMFPTRLTDKSTQVLTFTGVATNRATTRATDTAFDTTFDTTGLTNRLTDTSRVTSFATNRTTTTSYDTTVDTAYVTNRATTTSYNTTYSTFFNTNRSTFTEYTTGVQSDVLTNRLTSTQFNTTLFVDTSLNTSRSTSETRSTSKSTTTAYNTSNNASRSTDTSRTTTFNTTYNTQFLSTVQVNYLTWVDTISIAFTYSHAPGVGNVPLHETEFSVRKQRNTTRNSQATVNRQTTRSTSRNTLFATTTTFSTSVPTNRTTTTTFNTTYNTTTTFSTNRQTSLFQLTDRSTTTTYFTQGNAGVITTRATTTGFDTSSLTIRNTNAITETGFLTIVGTAVGTSFDTSTTFDTSATTTFQTLTQFNTTFATNRLTNHATSTNYDTVFDTGTTRLTDVITSVVTATVGATTVTTQTAHGTVALTNRATLTNRVTMLNTNVATVVLRDTSRNTVFVAYPTSFLTSFLTGTTAATDVQTQRITDRLTDTTYDTAYPTERLTSVMTQTDVAN